MECAVWIAQLKLEVLAKKLKDYKADQGGHNGNHKIGGRKNIMECVCESLPRAVSASKFTHQEIGIEEKHDKANFDRSPPNGGRFSRVIGIRGHGKISPGDIVAAGPSKARETGFQIKEF